MIYPARADIIPLLQHVMAALQPFAQTHGVRLEWNSPVPELTLWYEPKKVTDRLTHLVCEMISLMPCGSRIVLNLAVEERELVVSLCNTGIDLSRIGEITGPAKNDIHVQSKGNGSEFRFGIPLEPMHQAENAVPQRRLELPAQWRGFYALIRNSLRSHFSKGENLVSLLAQHHPRDAAFLQKVNALIQANIEDENFDSAALGKALCMSRTQLFRKLKPLIRQAPAQYIRVMRLEKAKQLLETSDLNIGEVTFRTGFQSQSHFTKAFAQHYGVAPSLFRRKATK